MGLYNEIKKAFKSTNNFTFLDEIIHSGQKEIKIEDDIILEEGEEKKYREGIFIDADDLIIDGNGHVIDARGQGRIFKIMADNFIIKNIILKEGYHIDGGSAIDNYSESNHVKIINSKITLNSSFKYGGAINNKGTVYLEDTVISHNNSQGHNGIPSSGAIYNEGKVKIINCSIVRNSVYETDGGAITNWNEILIKNSIISDNESGFGGGAIKNHGGATSVTDANLSIFNCKLENNQARHGGAIDNSGVLNLEESIINNNVSVDGEGGGIRNSNNVNIKNCDIINNKGENGAAISSDYGNMNIINSKFAYNRSENNGGAIDNSSNLILELCLFEENIAANYGGAIINGKNFDEKGSYSILPEKRCELKIVKNTFKNNIANKQQSSDIMNNAFLNLIKSGFNTKSPSILNNNKIYLEKNDKDVIERICDNGKLYFHSGLSEFNESFSYLEELIRAKAGINQDNIIKIILEKDIVLDTMNDEEKKYNEGILIDYENLIISGNGHSIDAKGKTRIFNVTGKNIVLENIIMENGYSQDGGAIINEGILSLVNCTMKNNKCIGGIGGGGALFNDGILTIEDCKLINNSSLGKDYHARGGGALANMGILNITNSDFMNNKSNANGGAIVSGLGFSKKGNNKNIIIENCNFSHNTSNKDGNSIYNEKEGNIRINNCNFYENKSNSILYNKSGNIRVFKSQFNNNQSDYIIVNYDQLELLDTSFKDNPQGSYIIYSINESRININGGKFSNNSMNESIIFNDGKYIRLNKSLFENNDSTYNIDNNSELILNSIKIMDEKSILNNGNIILNVKYENIKDIIDNKGTIKSKNIPQKLSFDFTYLNKLIHESNNNKVCLKHDITFKEYERDFFEGGVELDINGLTIDGNNHIIDAKNSSRIFTITAKNVTLENIVFKNGHSFKNYDNTLNQNGGAIRNNMEAGLKIINCKLIDNESEKNGGVIENKGELIIKDCEFNNCKSEEGGCIYNKGYIELFKSSFSNNHAGSGGGIYNVNKIIIKKNNFIKNSAAGYGGAINNEQGMLEIYDTLFDENSITTKHALVSGGAINNRGELKITTCSFVNNKLYEGSGSAIGTEKNGKTIQNNCIFENNQVLDKDDDY